MSATPTISQPYKRTSDGLWVVVINLGTGADGRRRRVTVARKKQRAAVDAAQTKLRELENGISLDAGKATVQTWLNYWFKYILPPKGLRPNTLRSYRTQIDSTLVPAIGTIQLRKLTPAHIREMHANSDQMGVPVSTSQLAHTVLKAALTAAVADKAIPENPADSVGSPKGDSDLRPALTLAQASHLIRTCEAAGDPMTYRFAAGVLTGARQGELLGLTWDRVDLDQGVVDLSWALVAVGKAHGCPDGSDGEPSCGVPRKKPAKCPQARLGVPRGYSHIPLGGPLVLGSTKTKSSRRMVPLIGPMVDALRAHREQYPPGPHNLVWTNPKTGTPIHPSTDHRRWHRALKRAGLPPMPLHSARHSAATIMQELRIDEAVRMKIVGHNSQAVHRGYAHTDLALTREALDTYGAALGIGA